MNDFDGGDKRLTRSSESVGVERVSKKKWHYCKYCYKKVPTFLLKEWLLPSAFDAKPDSIIRCCWECGSGIDRLA